MSAEHEVAGSVELTRLEFDSPWQTPLRTGRAGRWLAALAAAWREGMELYVRATMLRAHSQWWL
jgi:hypothetical protein